MHLTNCAQCFPREPLPHTNFQHNTMNWSNSSLHLNTTISLKSPVWNVSYHPIATNTLLITQKNNAVVYLRQQGAADDEGQQQQQEEKWGPVDVLSAHSRTVRRAIWSPRNGSKIALCSFDGTVSIWNRTNSEDNSPDAAASNHMSFELQTCLEGHENEVKSVKWDPSEEYIATCARDRTVWVWARDSDTMDDDEEPLDYEVMAVCNGHTQDVKDLQWHRTEPILISCSYDDTIRTWIEKLDDWFCCNILREHESTVWSMDQSSNGDLLVTVSDDMSIIIWKFVKYTTEEQRENDEDRPFTYEKLLRIPDAHQRAIYSVTWSPDDRCFVTVGGDNSIKVWSLASKEKITTQRLEEALSTSSSPIQKQCEVLNAHECDVNCISFHQKDPSLLVSGSDDETVKMWKLKL